MDLIEAIKTRKTIRAFKSDAVPQSILREILDAARNSPSWGNTQPWEFAAVSGSHKEVNLRINDYFARRFLYL